VWPLVEVSLLRGAEQMPLPEPDQEPPEIEILLKQLPGLAQRAVELHLAVVEVVLAAAKFSGWHRCFLLTSQGLLD
jgi:hypothetical protein